MQASADERKAAIEEKIDAAGAVVLAARLTRKDNMG